MKTLDPDPLQNQFLNRGIVLAGPDGGFLYVFTHSPPSVQRYGSDGRLIGEFALSGPSLDAHLGEARAHLAVRRREDVGGFELISAADFDETRGTVLVATGARQPGWEVIYEYGLDGVKVAEYALFRPNGSNIQRVVDLSVRRNRLAALDAEGGVHAFDLPHQQIFAAQSRLLLLAVGQLGNVADSLFPVASAAAPCTLASMRTRRDSVRHSFNSTIVAPSPPCSRGAG